MNGSIERDFGLDLDGGLISSVKWGYERGSDGQIVVSKSSGNYTVAGSQSTLDAISPVRQITRFADSKNLNNSKCTPELREINYCETILNRSRFQENPSRVSMLGPPDLVHRGKSCGVRSAEFNNNGFISASDEASMMGDDGGYVGTFHFVNGMGFDNYEQSIEEYLYSVMSLKKRGVDYFFDGDTKSNDSLSTGKCEVALTYCTYNIFDRLDFRVKLVVTMNGLLRRTPVNIDKTFLIVPNRSQDRRNRRTLSYNTRTVRNISPEYWEELKASVIVRTFLQLDSVNLQLPGLVTYSHYMDNKTSLLSSILTIVKLLERGYTCGTSAVYGNATSSGAQTNDASMTTTFRNHLVQTLLRLCQMDMGGEASSFTISAIRNIYYNGKEHGEWDYVILIILKNQTGTNNEMKFLELIHHHMRHNETHTTHLALILGQQVKFLITKGKFEQAKVIAQKCVSILPMDFECWMLLALSNILANDYDEALIVINTIPITMHDLRGRDEEFKVCGIDDKFSATFLERLGMPNQEVMSEKTFESIFPDPSVYGDSQGTAKNTPLTKLGSISKIWRDTFLFNSHLRHPICGNFFSQSPLMNCSSLELSSVDPGVIRLCGPSSSKSILSARSAGRTGASIIDLPRSSTWGKCYDLVSFMIARAGWNTISSAKERIFRPQQDFCKGPEFVVNLKFKKSNQIVCHEWLNQMFAVLYEDLCQMMTITSDERHHQHSALEWEMIGILGWLSKYSLNESLSSLVTSIIGNAREGKFDYFGTVACLEIYDEFILGGTHDSQIDLYNDDYNLTFRSNKCLVDLSGDARMDYTAGLEEKYLSLDFALLNLMKLVSWNVRWYQYVPNYLVFRILQKLILKYDQMFISTRMRIVFEENKKVTRTKPKSFMGNLRKSTSSKSIRAANYEFESSDTIVEYILLIMLWLQAL